MSQLELRLALERYRDLVRQAEAERLARRLARHGQSLPQTWRVKLGQALIALGYRLAPQLPPYTRPLGARGHHERSYRNTVL